jgi:hypothetical protein
LVELLLEHGILVLKVFVLGLEDVYLPIVRKAGCPGVIESLRSICGGQVMKMLLITLY